jgi:hypothetical protein
MVACAAALTALSSGVLVLTVPTEAAPPDSGRKQVQLACKPGWRASVAGQYGGVAFGLACDNGRSTAILEGTSGTSYSARMGVENDTGAFDCFFSGEANVVQERCVEVRLSIR